MTSVRDDTDMPVWADKIHTVGPTYRWARAADDVSMTTLALRAPEKHRTAEWSGAPRLRLLPKAERTRKSVVREPAPAHLEQGPAIGAEPSQAPVLIAGQDAATRARVRSELSELMPAGTRFEELGTFWELLFHAPSSRLVILSGDVDELPAESMLRTLAHRHPDLPVVSLEASAR
jgi:hypothetical protein